MDACSTGNSEWYTVEYKHVEFTLPVRYKALTFIGVGGFGAVIKAKDTKTGQLVAIKKILQPFQTKGHAKRVYRELKLLIYLNDPDAQVVQLYNVFTPEKSRKEFRTLYFVFNFIDYDLHRVILRFIPFSENDIKHIIYSILRGLKFIHSAGIYHRDIKPQNIGVDKNFNVTILDFGLARVESNADLTTYVATRWWRAPEVCTNKKQYNSKLDIWSVGAIMAELILLKPAFVGSDSIDQIKKIFEVIGTPHASTLDGLCSPDGIKIIERFEKFEKKNYQELFGIRVNPDTGNTSGVSEEGITFLDSLLQVDPRKRPTVENALRHPFLRSFSSVDNENSTEAESTYEAESVNDFDPMNDNQSMMIVEDTIENASSIDIQPLNELESTVDYQPTIQRLVDEHQGQDYLVDKWKELVWEMMETFREPPWATKLATEPSE